MSCLNQYTVAQLQALLASERLPAASLQQLQQTPAVAPLLLDVREPWEAALASIHTSAVATLLMPMAQITARWQELNPQQLTICYCHHGLRGLRVVAFLQRQGFDSVYNLAGGIDAWSNEADGAVPRY